MAEITNTSLSKLYLATFGRPLDANGLAYWTNTGIYANGLGGSIASIEVLSENFALQTEYLELYPSDIGDTSFINSIYQNLFQRDADSDGLAYWLENLSSGNMTRDKAILTIINGAQNTASGNDLDLLTNRTQAALTLALDYSISDALAKSTVVKAAFLSITDDSSSIDQQINYILNVLNTTDISNINNSLGSLSSSDTYGVSSLDSGSYWYHLLDTVSYSFNSTIPQDYYIYDNNGTLTTGWTELNSEQKNVTRSIIDKIDDLIALNLEEVPSGGDIQFNLVDMDTYTAGFSFMPGSFRDYMGDIFLNTDFNTHPEDYGLSEGEWGYSTIVHEFGHALGLKHPFEGDITLPPSQDDLNHTVMAYNNINNYIPEFSFFPTSIYIDYISLMPELYSLYDVAALQSIYGVNDTTNLADNVYTLSYQDYKLTTIWDAGGQDTIDLSHAVGNSTVDLNSGTINSADEYSLGDVISLHQDIATANGKSQHNTWIAEEISNLYLANSLYTGKNNLTIATGTIIENINTGEGDDIVTDNEVNNIINTLDGQDKIYIGNGGIDTIDAGEGIDTLYLDINYDEILNIMQDNQMYTITTDTFEVNFINVEQIVFVNGVVYTPELLI